MVKTLKNQNAHTRETLQRNLREFRCLYSIANITGRPDKTLNERLSEVVDTLPRAFPKPGNICCRVSVNGEVFKTANFKDTGYLVSADINVKGKTGGKLDIGCLKTARKAGTGCFDKQDRRLINSVAEQLGSIIERRIMEDTLRESQEFLRSISNASPMAIYVMQGEKIKYTSRQFQTISGYSHEETLDTSLLALVPDADKDVVRSSIAYTIEGNKTYPCEYRIINKNGQVKWVMQTVAPIHYEGKGAILGSLMDITERKFLEREVTEYEELDKMKSDILATVSHELRTPLAAVKGYATMILDYSSKLDPEETMEYLININNSADRLINMVDNLIDTSRLDSGLLELKKSSASVSGLIKSVVKLVSLRVKNHAIVARLPNHLPQSVIDARRIKQVIENLISNAARYSPEGADIIVSAVKKGNEIQISVADRGPAIPSSELKNIFDRMYKIENRLYAGADGMGLGLHICQRLVEAHGGLIWAESAAGKGTTIRFTLPVLQDDKHRKQGYRQNQPISHIL
jgi:hypothetical protein